ncbi:MAG: hypothetical protein IT496_11825 [Gammaproteobacteria bacterium]|nr:hypothetical protein [Gammaproteobacteria bacterium]MCG3143315.1 hypothetical protein [Gammaproteobacteria bacterium]
MQAVVIILKVLALALAIAGLVGGGICTLCGAVWSFEDAGVGMQIVGISLLFAVPSYFLTRLLWRSLNRRPGAAPAPSEPASSGDGP